MTDEYDEDTDAELREWLRQWTLAVPDDRLHGRILQSYRSVTVPSSPWARLAQRELRIRVPLAAACLAALIVLAADVAHERLAWLRHPAVNAGRVPAATHAVETAALPFDQASGTDARSIATSIVQIQGSVAYVTPFDASRFTPLPAGAIRVHRRGE